VCHKDVGSFAHPAELFGVEAAQVSPVAVAIDSTERAKLGEARGQFQRTDVAGVPYLVA